MSFRSRLILVFSLATVLVVTLTASVLSWNARQTIFNRAERDGELIAELLARSAGAAERVPHRVETLLGKQMLAQARLVAEYVAASEAAEVSSEIINQRLRAITEESTIDEIWVTDSQGHAYLSSTGVTDFVFNPDPEKQPQASEFWGLLTGDRQHVIQDAKKREIDELVFKYAGVTGIDQPRIVEVGLNAELLVEIRRDLGLEFMVQSLLEGGEINAIWVFSSDLEAIAWGSVLGPSDAPRPDQEELELLKKVYREGQSSSILRDEQLVVMAPIPDEAGHWQGVTLLRLSLQELDRAQQELVALSVKIALLVLLLGLPVILLLARRITNPVERISQAALSVERGEFDLPELDPVAQRPDELGRLAQVFQRMAEQVGARQSWLEEQVQARTCELEERNVQLARAHQRVQDELDVASALQLAILPARFPALPGIDIHARMRPAREMGGDFYDLFVLDERRTGLVVADVAGKGVPAAFFMAICRTELQAAAQHGRPPAEVLEAVNRMLVRQNPLELFVTTFYGIFDHGNGEFVYANGGHNPPLIVSASGEARWLPTTGGMALGMFDELPFEQQTVTIEPGDTLLLYTDGVTEAFDPQGNEYGEEKLVAELQKAAGDSAKQLIDRLFASVDEHARGTEQSDDLTALALCRERETAWCEQLSLAPELDRLPEITEWVEHFCSMAGCPTSQTMQLVLALDELFVNIVNHGFPGVREHGMVQLMLSAQADKLHIQLDDNGEPFDPTARATPDLEAPLDEREIGGLGIHLVRQAVDQIAYEYSEGMNRLSMDINIRSNNTNEDL
ncbi:MAG: ATP-binding SpoIIE family protein phosphatase [Pseudomonadota bacterium]